MGEIAQNKKILRLCKKKCAKIVKLQRGFLSSMMDCVKIIETGGSI